MKKLLFALLTLSSMVLVGCKGYDLNPSNKSSNSSEDTSKESSSSIDGEGDYIVKFYLDFNQFAVGNIYYQYRTDNDTKVKKIANPTSDKAPLPEFPVFKGWSTKQTLDDESELWDFDNDTMHCEPGYYTFNLIGFWAAEGE